MQQYELAKLVWLDCDDNILDSSRLSIDRSCDELEDRIDVSINF